MLLTDLDDNTVYKIKSLPCWMRGDVLKGPSTIYSIWDTLRRKAEGLDRKSRYYPDPSNFQVYQYRHMPPTYIITPHFKPVQQLVWELSMVCKPNDIYYSMIISGDDYFKCLRGYSYKLEESIIEGFDYKFDNLPGVFSVIDDSTQHPASTTEFTKALIERLKKYSVELFGVIINLPDGVSPSGMLNPPVPAPSQYTSPPRYIRDISMNTVQIYRLRIFNCPSEAMHPTPSNPLSPRRPTCLFFEERWHPHTLKEQAMRGLENLPHFRFTEVGKFWADCQRLTETVKKLGRPLGSGEYQDSTQFNQDVTDAYRKCFKRLGRKPSQRQVAEELLMSRSRFSEKLSEFGIPWPPC